MTISAAERGKANRRKGHDAERAACRWLRDNGFPGAERSVRAGFTAHDRSIADLGDITGVPGIVFQVKDVARSDIPKWMEETEQQRQAAEADHGLLVQRRRGTADVGKWWVHVTGRTFAVLLTGRQDAPEFECVARVTLAELVPLLWRAGYGTAPAEVA